MKLIHNVLGHINCYMNIGISNWHVWSFDTTKITFYFISVLYTILTSKHLKRFFTYPVERNGAMWKKWYSAPKNAKKEQQLKHKNQEGNW